MQYLIDRYKGKVLSRNVQGFGVTNVFDIRPIGRKQYDKAEPIVWGGRATSTEKILLSETSIEGFPENIKIISETLRKK